MEENPCYNINKAVIGGKFMIFEKQILNMYRGMMHNRCDDTETVFYFSPEDFPGLGAEIGRASCRERV